MKGFRKTVSIIMALILIFSFTLPAFADDTAIATTMRITEKEGTVTVKNASGKSVTVRNDMRLYSGYTVATEKDSTVYISLDDSKAIKLDSNSNISIKKNGKKLEVQVVSGSIFFNVTEPLKGDESLNIRTTTMVTGIRGTSGQASVMPAEVRLDKNGRPEADYLWDESVILFTGHAEITATKSTTVDGAIVSTDELIKGVEAEGSTGTAQPGTTGTITVEERKDAKSVLESIFKPKETVEVKVDKVDVEIFAGETVVSRSLGVEGNVEEFQVEKVSAVKEDISASALEEIIKDEDLQEKIAESSDLITNEEGQIDTTVLETLVEEKKEEEAIAVAEKEEAFEEAKENIEIEAVDEHVFEPVVDTEPAGSGSAGGAGNDYSDPDPTPEEPAPEEPAEDPTKIVLSGDHVDAQNYIAVLKDETIETVIIDGGRVELTGDNCEGDSANVLAGKTVTFTNGAEFLVGQRVTFDVYGTLTFEEGTSFDNAGVINILSNNSVHIKSTHAAISGVIKIGSENASGLLDVEGSLVTAPGSNNISIEIINGEISVGSTGVVASNIIVTGNGTKSGRGSIRYNEAPISMTVASGATATISEGRVYGVVCSNNASLTVNGGIIKQNDGLEGASSLDVQSGTVNLNSGSIENSNVNGFAITLSRNNLPNVTLGDNFVVRTKNYQDTPLQNTKWVDDSEDGWYRLVKYDYSNLDDPTYAEFVDALAHTNSVTLTNVNKTSRKFVVEANGLSIPDGKTVDIKSGNINMNGSSITINEGAELSLNGVSITNCVTIDVLKGAKLDVASEINASAEIYNNGTTNFKSGKVGCIWNEKTNDSESILNITGGELLSTTGTNEDASTWIHYGLQAGEGSITTISNASIGGIGVSPTAKVTMESGTVNGEVWTGEGSELTINDGTLNGGIEVGSGSTLIVNGGTVRGLNQAIKAVGSVVTINSGTLENDASGSDYMGVLYCYGCLTTINGGSIINNQDGNQALKIIGNDTTDLTTISENALILTKNADDYISGYTLERYEDYYKFVPEKWDLIIPESMYYTVSGAGFELNEDGIYKTSAKSGEIISFELIPSVENDIPFDLSKSVVKAINDEAARITTSAGLNCLNVSVYVAAPYEISVEGIGILLDEIDDNNIESVALVFNDDHPEIKYAIVNGDCNINKPFTLYGGETLYVENGSVIVDSDGYLNVCGMVILGEDKSLKNDASVTINGGSVEGKIVNNEDGSLTIYNGVVMDVDNYGQIDFSDGEITGTLYNASISEYLYCAPEKINKLVNDGTIRLASGSYDEIINNADANIEIENRKDDSTQVSINEVNIGSFKNSGYASIYAELGKVESLEADYASEMYIYSGSFKSIESSGNIYIDPVENIDIQPTGVLYAEPKFDRLIVQDGCCYISNITTSSIISNNAELHISNCNIYGCIENNRELRLSDYIGFYPNGIDTYGIKTAKSAKTDVMDSELVNHSIDGGYKLFESPIGVNFGDSYDWLYHDTRICAYYEESNGITQGFFDDTTDVAFETDKESGIRYIIFAGRKIPLEQTEKENIYSIYFGYDPETDTGNNYLKILDTFAVNEVENIDASLINDIIDAHRSISYAAIEFNGLSLDLSEPIIVSGNRTVLLRNCDLSGFSAIVDGDSTLVIEESTFRTYLHGVDGSIEFPETPTYLFRGLGTIQFNMVGNQPTESIVLYGVIDGPDTSDANINVNLIREDIYYYRVKQYFFEKGMVIDLKMDSDDKVLGYIIVDDFFRDAIRDVETGSGKDLIPLYKVVLY